MRGNPYKIGESGESMPRLKRILSGLPSLKGREGRWWRRGLIALGVIIVALIAARFLKPETQLMNTVEIRRIESKGILCVAVRDDIPGFCENGEGLEAELARLLAERILPDSDDPVKLITCTSKTVTTKLQDGSADIAIALQPKGTSSAYSYSYPYYTDKVSLVTLSEENRTKDLSDLIIGYIPGTPAGNLFSSYVSKITATAERSMLDKLLRRPAPTPDPETAVTVETVKYGSYDELIVALKNGEIDAAVMSGVYISKYFRVYAEQTGVDRIYICEAEIGSLQYCMVASSDDAALTQLADMLIYELKESGDMEDLIARFVR